MRKREEYIEEAQELFEAMNFGEYIVEETDNWDLDFHKEGALIAEANLSIYVSPPDHGFNDPTERAFVTVTFDAKTDKAEDAYCDIQYGDTIAEVNPKEYRALQEATNLARDLENNLSTKKNKLKV